MGKIRAFTLAETLIALALIAVLALLFILGIKHKSNHEEIKTALYDKVYDDIYTATKTTLTFDKKNTAQLAPDVDSLRNDITKRLDITDKWDNGKDNWKNCNNPNGIVALLNRSCDDLKGAKLSNGANVAFVSAGSAAVDVANFANALSSLSGHGLGGHGGGSVSVSGLVGAALIDTNGNGAPNKGGDDQYVVPIYEDGLGDGNTDVDGGGTGDDNPTPPNTNVPVTPGIDNEEDCQKLSSAHMQCSMDNGKCVCKCDANYAYIGGQCKRDCYNPNNNAKIAEIKAGNSRFILDENDARCYRCNNEVNNQRECEQASRGIWSSTDCTCTECKNLMISTGEKCECPADIANICAKADKYDEAECKCICEGESRFFDGQDCITCSDYQVTNAQKNGCECRVKDKDCNGGSYSTNTCECECNENSTPNGSKNEASACICNAGYYRQGADCVVCGTGNYCTGDEKQNACGNGKTTATETATKEEECICDANYYKDGNECIQCPENSTAAMGMATSIYDCKCTAQGTYMDGAQCALCPEGSYCSNGERTLCPSDRPYSPFGSTNISQCMTCEEFNPSTPLWTVNGCEACSNGFEWDGKGCSAICDNGTTYVDGACRLVNAKEKCKNGDIPIYTPEDLAKIGHDARYSLSDSYCLMNDISLSAYGSGYNNGQGWLPIGSGSKFTGRFEGNDKKISDLWIMSANERLLSDPEWEYFYYMYEAFEQNKAPDFSEIVEWFNEDDYGDPEIIEWNNEAKRLYYDEGWKDKTYLDVADIPAGLFSVTDGATIQNLRLENVSINVANNSAIGGLVGIAKGGKITNCSAIVDISGADVNSLQKTGGLIGVSFANVTNSNTSGSVSSGNYAGGLIGENHSDVSNLYSTAAVTGRYNVGGLIGYSQDGAINNCHAENSVIIASDDAGGLVGSTTSPISHSYALNVSVDSSRSAGGLTSSSIAHVSYSYATGTVKAPIAGGLMYYAANNINNCYFEGNIESSSGYTGGLIGYANNANVENCYSISSMAGRAGLVGDFRSGSIKNSYSAGLESHKNSFSSGSGTLGVVYQSTITTSFYESEIVGQYTPGRAEPRFPEEMKNDRTFIKVGWTTSDWCFSCGDYPHLKGMPPGAHPTTNCQTECACPANYELREQVCVPLCEGEGEYWTPGERRCVIDLEPDDPERGKCTKGYYYPIHTPQELAKIGKDPRYPLDACYIQTNDLDLSEYRENDGWDVIGIWGDIFHGIPSAPFRGVYNGNYNKITNLYINSSVANKEIGLFGYANGCVVKNLALIDVDITSKGYSAGGLIGRTSSGSSTISKISNCYVSGKIKTTEYCVGGLVGSSHTKIYNSSTDVEITGNSQAGGLVGSSTRSDAEIVNCYAKGTIKAGASAGGLIGQYYYGGTTNSYASCKINGAGGGFIGEGYNVGVDSTNFYDSEVANVSHNGYGNGKTTPEMQLTDTFTAANWSEDIWCLNCGKYPVLKNMPKGAPDATSCNLCKACNANATHVKGVCVCDPGYTGDGYECTPCGNKCLESDNKKYKDNSCECTCINVPAETSTEYKNKVDDGFIWKNEACQWTLRCTGANEQYADMDGDGIKECTCQSGYYKVNGVCTLCSNKCLESDNKKYKNNSCECTCINVPAETSTEYKNKVDDGYVWKNETCQWVSRCTGTNEQYADSNGDGKKECTCKAGFYRVNGVCTPCDRHHYCPGGEVENNCYNDTKSEAEIRPFIYYTGAKSKEECKSCYQIDSTIPIYIDEEGSDIGTCKSCALGEIWNTKTHKCEFNCSFVPTCKSGSTLTTYTDGVNKYCKLNGENAIAISSAQELASIGKCPQYPLSGNYKMLDNIDLSAYGADHPIPTGGYGWEPIGDPYRVQKLLCKDSSGNSKYNTTICPYSHFQDLKNKTSFTGTFDGNSKIISNLFIKDYNTGYTGLFSFVDGSNSSLKNIIFDKVNIDISNGEHGGQNKSVGALAGYLSGTAISNVTVSGNIVANSSDEVGGIVGAFYSGSAANLSSSAYVSGYSEVGGLIGRAGWGEDQKVSVENSSSTSKVDAVNTKAGGIAGDCNNCTLTNVYTEGDISGNSFIGGLVGEMVSYTTGDAVTLSHSGSKITANSAGGGGLIGVLYNGSKIKNVYATGSVSGQNSLGGLVGICSECTVESSYATGKIEGTGVNIGGLVGSASNMQLKYVYATGEVSGNEYVGGLLGGSEQMLDNYWGWEGDESIKIDNAFATGKVSGNNYIGGLAGCASKIKNSYATGDVSGSSYIGGLAGKILWSYTNTYAIGNVSATNSYSGGLAGYEMDSSEDISFWNEELTEQSEEAGYIYYEMPYSASEAKSTAEMIQANIYLDAGWSTSDWCFSCGDYPHLKGMPEGAPSTTNCRNTDCVDCSKYVCSNSLQESVNIGDECVCTCKEVLTCDENEKLEWNEGSCACEIKCDTYEEKINGECVCVNGYYRSTSTGNCTKCASTKPLTVNGVCKKCSDVYGSEKPQWNSTQKECVPCPTGQTWTGSKCAVVTTCNSSTGLCTLNQNVNTCGSGYIAISSADEFKKIGNVSSYPVSGNYCLMNSITIVDFDRPISSFSGIFDGNKNSITYNIKPNTSSWISNAALFGTVNGGTIRNLHVDATMKHVKTGGDAAGLANEVRNGHIINCSANVDIISDDNEKGYCADLCIASVGGLINFAYESEVKNCSATGTIVANQDVGGLIENASYSTITNSYSDVDIRAYATSYFGGFIGIGGTNTISECFAIGDIYVNSENSNMVGGFIGLATYDTISDCFARGNVTGGTAVGGFAGYANTATIENCYATGDVSGYQSVGGFVGQSATGEIAYSFADNTVSGSDSSSSYKNYSNFIGGFIGEYTNPNNTNTVHNCHWQGNIINNGKIKCPISTDSSCKKGLFVGYMYDYINNSFYENTYSSGSAGSFTPIGYCGVRNRGSSRPCDYDYIESNTYNYPQLAEADLLEYPASYYSPIYFWSNTKWCLNCGSYPFLKNVGPDFMNSYSVPSCGTRCPSCAAGSYLKNYVCSSSKGYFFDGDSYTSSVVNHETHTDNYIYPPKEYDVYKLTSDVGSCKAGDILIYDEEDLRRITVDSYYPATGSYCLVNDIQLTGYKNPISDDFQGQFNGNGKTISNLYITEYDGYGNGLFRSTTGNVVIKNLILENVSIPNGGYAGALVGFADGNITVDNLVVKNAQIHGSAIGVLIGNAFSDNMSITNVTIDGADMTTTSRGASIGLLVGNNYGYTADLSNIFVDNATISGTLDLAVNTSTHSYFGGLIGSADADITLHGNIDINAVDINIDANNTYGIGFIAGNIGQITSDATISITNSNIHDFASTIYSKISSDCSAIKNKYSYFSSSDFTCNYNKLPSSYTSACPSVVNSCNNIINNCGEYRACNTIKTQCQDAINYCSRYTSCTNRETLTGTKNIRTDINNIAYSSSTSQCYILQYASWTGSNILVGSWYDSDCSGVINISNVSINDVNCTSNDMCYLLDDYCDFDEEYMSARVSWR